MPKRTTPALKNVTVDKSAFDTLLSVLVASPPIRKDDLKPKRGTAKKRAKGGEMTAKNKRIAALVATHNMDLAGKMDRRVTIQDGQVVELA